MGEPHLAQRVRTDYWPTPHTLQVDAEHRLNIELDLQNLFGHNVYSCTHWLRPHNPPPSFLRIWAHIRGRYWSAQIDDSLCGPLTYADTYNMSENKSFFLVKAMVVGFLKSR